MSRTIQLSKKARWGAVRLCAIEFLCAVFVLGVFTQFVRLPLDSFPIAFLGPIILYSIVTGFRGLFGLIHLAQGWYRLRELVLDGDTVTIRVPGRSDQSFTRDNFRGYLPHRNVVLTDDSRAILLPVSIPWLGFHEPEMAEPWLESWWPGVRLPDTIRRAEAARGWINWMTGVPVRFLFVIFLLSTICMLNAVTSSVSITAFGLSFSAAVYVPELVERLLNRRVIIPRDLLDELSRADSATSDPPESTREPRRDDCTEI